MEKTILETEKEDLVGKTVLELKIEYYDFTEEEAGDHFAKLGLDFCYECLTVSEIDEMIPSLGDYFICTDCFKIKEKKYTREEDDVQ